MKLGENRVSIIENEELLQVPLSLCIDLCHFSTDDHVGTWARTCLGISTYMSVKFEGYQGIESKPELLHSYQTLQSFG